MHQSDLCKEQGDMGENAPDVIVATNKGFTEKYYVRLVSKITKP